MKNLVKILLAYLVGILLVFTLVWRVDNIDSHSKTSYNVNSEYAYN